VRQLARVERQVLLLAILREFVRLFEGVEGVVAVVVALMSGLVRRRDVVVEFLVDSLDIRSLEVETCVVEEDGSHLDHQREEEGIDNCHILVAAADTRALGDMQEIVVAVVAVVLSSIHQPLLTNKLCESIEKEEIRRKATEISTTRL